MQTMWRRARRMADATPPERDRYIDFLRVLSIAVVVLGHWLMAAVMIRDGEVFVDHPLTAAPRIQYITWVLQVMPIFFIVGGYANEVSWASAHRKGNGYSVWLQDRTVRLLRPTMVFAAVWAVVTSVLVMFGTDVSLLRVATQVVAVPLWFLAVYVGVVVLAPVMLRLDDRFGWSVPAALVVAAALVDAASRGLGIPGIGWINFLFVWLGIHQLGVRWRRGAMPSRPTSGVLMATVGLTGLLILTTIGSYPVSMVGVPGMEWTNNLPPTVVLMVLAVFQMGIILAIRTPLTGWLEREVVWSAVVVGNGRIMTVYLWHMTAMVAVIGFGLWFDGVGFGIDPLSGAWWWSRLLWIVVLAVPLAGLSVIFGSFEEKRPAKPVAALGSVVGLLAVIWGFAQLALHGFVAAGSAGVAFAPALAVVMGSWTLGVRPNPTAD